jgi:hypothetical protein
VRGRRWLLRHASDSQVRLQVTADRAASEHIGGSRNRGIAGLGAVGAAIVRADAAARLKIGEQEGTVAQLGENLLCGDARLVRTTCAVRGFLLRDGHAGRVRSSGD